MTAPVTWNEVSVALGEGEARRVAIGSWNKRHTVHMSWFREEFAWRVAMTDCLVRAELWCVRAVNETSFPCTAEMADRIRAIRERLEREVWNA